MSATKIPAFIIRCIAITVLLPVLFWLSGCAGLNNSPAPIRSVDGNIGTNSVSSSIITISPPKIGATNPQQMFAIRPMVSYAATKKTQTQLTKQLVQTNKNNYSVYNRYYMNIQRGSYTGGSTYTVKRGDTLFYIAWITGNDLRDLAKKNKIQAPYDLRVGQTLQVGNITNRLLIPGNTTLVTNVSAQNNIVTSTKKTAIVTTSQPVIMYPQSSSKQTTNKILPNDRSTTTIATALVTHSATSSTSQAVNSTVTILPISAWCWPTDKGKIIENFSPSEGGNKGIDIAGSKGQAIVATADGRVVYAGNALRGYGNLIIIKHNDDYLSAYAHNEKMLVWNQQKVKVGQKIATMGNTGTNSTRLHFEIRYKGKSVNPLQYLPHR